MAGPDLLGASEIVDVGGEPLLAFPRGRHAALRARPPRVSVGVPCSGEARALEATLASLAAQTLDDVAIAIVDDASRGEGFLVGCRFADAHPRAVVYQHPRPVGSVATWNRCLDVAVGEHTKLLPSGERLAPGFLACLVGLLDADPDLALVRTATADDAPFDSSRALTGAAALIHALTGADLAGAVGAQLVRRAVVEGYHLRFRPELGASASFEWALRLLARGDFAYVADALWSPAPGSDEPARGPVEQFVAACEARLSALRDLPAALEPVALVRTLERVTALYHGARQALEGDDGAADARALDGRYARVLDELTLQLHRAAGDATDAADARRSRERPALAHLLAQADEDTRAHRYQAAEVPIRRILAAEPWNVEALNGLGVLRYHQADLAGARKYLASVLDLDPANPLARENLALLAAG
jgi:hypothetical protein